MARGKKTGGRDWTPGNGGPGRPRLSDMEKSVRNATREQIADVAQGMIEDGTLRDVIRQAFQNNLQAMLDRIIGKVPQKSEITGAEGGPLEVDMGLLSDAELRKLTDTIRKRAKISAPTDT